MIVRITFGRVPPLWSVVAWVASGALTLGCGSSAADFRVQRPRRPIDVNCGRQFPRFDARRLLGLTERAAEAAAKRHQCQLRPVERDRHALPITDDYASNRIDVVVVDGHVVRIKFVG